MNGPSSAPFPRRPRALTIVAWIFILYGVCEAVAMVLGLLANKAVIKITVLMIPVGIGLLRGRSSSVDWARVWIGLWGIGCLGVVILYPFAREGSPVRWVSKEWLGMPPDLVAIGGPIVILVLMWRALKVLGSDATRAYVEASERASDLSRPPLSSATSDDSDDLDTGSLRAPRALLHQLAARGSELTTVANCLNVAEALRLQSALQAVEIPCFIPDENMAAIAPHHFLLGSGVRVQVADEDAEEARRVIAEAKEEDRREWEGDQGQKRE